MILELLHAITVFRVDSVECQIECGICFMTETQNSASFFRPNELTTLNLPSERARMTQLLSLGQVLPPSLQVGLRRLQIIIGFGGGDSDFFAHVRCHPTCSCVSRIAPAN